MPAAAIRLTARRSIRRRKKPSRPGSPPHTQTGRLKRSIRYEVDKATPDVVIGPVNEIAGRLWHLHEHGGVAKKRRRLKRHRFRAGEFGPVRVKQQGSTAKFARIRLQTAAQANRATRLIEEENQRRGAIRPPTLPETTIHATRSRYQPITAAEVLARLGEVTFNTEGILEPCQKSNLGSMRF